jgi:hypothetical protein
MQGSLPIKQHGMPKTPCLSRIRYRALCWLDRRSNDKLVCILVAGEADAYKALMIMKTLIQLLLTGLRVVLGQKYAYFNRRNTMVEV